MQVMFTSDGVYNIHMFTGFFSTIELSTEQLQFSTAGTRHQTLARSENCALLRCRMTPRGSNKEWCAEAHEHVTLSSGGCGSSSALRLRASDGAWYAPRDLWPNFTAHATRLDLNGVILLRRVQVTLLCHSPTRGLW